MVGRSHWPGRETNPAQFAMQPAGLNNAPHAPVLSPDGSKQAQGHTVHRGFGDLGWDNRQNEFGSFVRVTEIATEKTWTWRVADAQGSVNSRLWCSCRGTKLAGGVKEPSGGAILIWTVPK